MGKGVKDLPISAQGLSAVCRADLPASGGLARQPLGGPDPKSFVNSLGLPR